MTDTPSPPPGAKANGTTLWNDMVGRYELEQRELAVLREAVRLTDLVAELGAVVERDGPMITDHRGEPRVHPAAIEARQSGIALARVLAALRLPEEDDPALGRRPQRRSGVRGVYSLSSRGAS